MARRNNLINAKDVKMAEAIQERSFKCSYCGHRNFMNYKTNSCRCSYCSHIVKKDKQTNFKDRIRQVLNRG